MSQDEKLSNIIEFVERVWSAGKLVLGTFFGVIAFAVMATAWVLTNLNTIHDEIHAQGAKVDLLGVKVEQVRAAQESQKSALIRVSDREEKHHSETLTALLNLASHIATK